MGAVALAQTSTTSGNSSKSSSHHASQSSTQSVTPAGQPDASSSSASSNSSVQAGNSGFDTDASTAVAQNSGNQTPTSSTPGSAQSGSSYSTPTQSGSSDTQSITNGPVAETITDSSALIGWSTHNPANGSTVKYGTSRANLTQTAESTDTNDGKNHHARLQGLSPSTRYYFQVTENGQPMGGVGTFKTTASGEQPVQSKAVIPQK